MANQKITDLSADAAPTSDDLIVTVNDPAGTPTNRKVTLAAAVAAGGAAVFGPVTIDDPAGFAAVYGTLLAESYEFNAETAAATLPTGWSLLNSATYDEGGGKGAVTISNGGGSTALRGIQRALPATWTNVIAKVRIWGTPAGSNKPAFGIGFRDNTTSEILSFSEELGTSNVLSTVVNKWNSPTSFNSSFGSLTAGPASQEKYFRIRKNSGTSYDFLMSPDGAYWVTVVAAADPTAFLTPDRFCVLGDAPSVGAAVLVDWVRWV